MKRIFGIYRRLLELWSWFIIIVRGLEGRVRSRIECRVFRCFFVVGEDSIIFSVFMCDNI